MLDICLDAADANKSGQADASPACVEGRGRGRSSAGLNLISQSMRHEYLNRELEGDLARAWRDHGDEKARDRLILSHLRLASRYVAKMKRVEGAENDLMQEAALGLMRAVSKFDPDKGFNFSTYAQWWIRSFVQDAIMRDKSVRLKSSSTNRAVFFMAPHIESKAEEKLRLRGEAATQEEISREMARMMGIEVARLEEIRSAMPLTGSLNECVAKNEDSAVEKVDLLVGDVPSPEDLVIEKSSKAFATKKLVEAFSVLNEREACIIRKRSMSLEPLTLEQLSAEFGVSRERVRQIEVRALEKLRGKLEEMGIESMGALMADA